MFYSLRRSVAVDLLAVGSHFFGENVTTVVYVAAAVIYEVRAPVCVCVCELMPVIHEAGYETKRSPSRKPLGQDEGIKGGNELRQKRLGGMWVKQRQKEKTRWTKRGMSRFSP